MSSETIITWTPAGSTTPVQISPRPTSSAAASTMGTPK